MNPRCCSLLAALMMAVWAAPSFAQPAAQDPITIRVIGDPVSAVDGLISLARDFSQETGINVVVEKDGFKDALEKATNDLGAKSGNYDIVLQEGAALGKLPKSDAVLSALTDGPEIGMAPTP